MTQIWFDETTLAAAVPEKTRVRIWVRLDGRRIAAFHSTVRRSDGTPVYESDWTAGRPKDFRSREWPDCQEHTEPPPSPRLTTLDDLLEDVLGPRTRPADARPVRGTAGAWEISRGVGVLRIIEHGGYLDREVETYSTKGRIAGRITGARTAPAAALPAWEQNWSSCRPATTEPRS
ncbi:hypothetical protein [Actinomadura macrotermitis]|uniref:hypothetical protein n=1 Tax=Actinomadura macrotermitis TaxID=2585200 RepID=UPI00129510FD|nr:hypothetical protein [Actinomadura macrotermitis]